MESPEHRPCTADDLLAPGQSIMLDEPEDLFAVMDHITKLGVDGIRWRVLMGASGTFTPQENWIMELCVECEIDKFGEVTVISPEGITPIVDEVLFLRGFERKR
jgi:hypothetical protein